MLDFFFAPQGNPSPDPSPSAPMPLPSSPAAADADREVEWQLLAENLEPVRQWLAAHPKTAGLDIAPRPSLRLRDTYLDTADWRLLRGGFALRIRERDDVCEATLKSLRSARDDLADRQEITEVLEGGPAALSRASGSVGARLREIAGTAQLEMLFRAQTVRQRFAARRPGQAQDAAEIALDETSLHARDGTLLERLRRVEIEAIGGDAEPLTPFVLALSAACALERARENKFAAGLRAAGLAPPRT